MKNQFVKCFISVGLVVISSGNCTDLFSQTAGEATKMEYKYSPDKPISYLNSGTMALIMDIQGQTMEIDIASAFGCTVKSAGKQDKNLKLEIIIDTIGQTTNSPMGGSGGAVQGVKGKSCSIIIAPGGKIVDLSGAAGLVYSIEGSGESNLTQSLSDFFQVLPDKPVTTGDTWSMADSVEVKSSSMTMKTIDNSVNKMEGFETVNGIKCAKISSQHSGIMTMNVQNQGTESRIKGPYTGTSECFFALNEGYFIRLSSATKVTGNMEITSPQAMTMPITIDMKSVNEMK